MSRDSDGLPLAYPIFRILLAILVLLAISLTILLAVRNWLIWRADEDWRRVQTEVNAVDPDWRLEAIEAKREKLPNESNSARVIIQIHEHGWINAWGNCVAKADFEPDAEGHEHDRASPDGVEVEPLPMPEEWFEQSIDTLIDYLPPEARLPPRLARQLDRVLVQNRPALTEALRLKDMPLGRFPIKFTPDFWSTNFESEMLTTPLAHLLALESVRRSEAGDTDGALTCLRACLNAARSLGDEPFCGSLRVRGTAIEIAAANLERVLAHGQASEIELAKLQKAFESELAEPRIKRALRGERAGTIKLCDAIISGEFDRSELVNPDVKHAFGPILGSFSAHLTRPHAFRLFTQAIEITDQPSERWQDDLAAIEEEAEHGTLLTGHVCAGVIRLALRELRIRAVLDTAIIAIAAERFRLARGRWPKDVHELGAHGFLRAAPTDPYTGGPIRLKSTRTGLAIYSVGPDKKDDDGERHPDGSAGSCGILMCFSVYEVPRVDRFAPAGDIDFHLFSPGCRAITLERAPMPRKQ